MDGRRHPAGEDRRKNGVWYLEGRVAENRRLRHAYDPLELPQGRQQLRRQRLRLDPQRLLVRQRAVIKRRKDDEKMGKEGDAAVGDVRFVDRSAVVGRLSRADLLRGVQPERRQAEQGGRLRLG